MYDDDAVTLDLAPVELEAVYEGIVLNTATTTATKVYVTIKQADQEDDDDIFAIPQRVGPVQWSPRGADYPTKGDSCLVSFSDGHRPWLADWIPSSPTALPSLANVELLSRKNAINGYAGLDASGKVPLAAIPSPTFAGTRSARPAANAVVVGAFYYATDNGITYRSDGASTWTAISWQALRVTALPTSPTPEDNQLVDYVADAALGILFRFRYNAGSASTYKWESDGNTDLIAVVDASNTVGASAVYADLTGGPTLTLPLAGDWYITTEGNMFKATGLGYVQGAYRMSGGTTAVADDNTSIGWVSQASASGSNTPAGDGSRMRRKNGLGANTVLTYQGKTSDAVAASIRWRALRARPIRCI